MAERLGFAPDARVLIVNCDDLGSSHAANVGVYDSLREGVATSATLMVPCPWARGAGAAYRGGGFPRTVADVWEHADLDEVRRECRAQVERAIYWGFDVSHLDSHMGTLQLRPEFFDVYLDLADEFRLPLRLSGAATERVIGFPFRRLASERGVLFPDHFVYVNGVGSRQGVSRALESLPPGVTEVYFHPAADMPELRAMSPDWRGRVDDHDYLVDRGGLRREIERYGIQLIGYRQLRDLMASAVPAL